MLSVFLSAILVVTSSTLVLGQTFTDCNPTEKTCPANPALARTQTTDFAKGEDQSLFKLEDGTVLHYDSKRGAAFSISNDNEAPTVMSTEYMFFGKVEATVQASPGVGIVTSIVLLSKDLDEIDWEIIGNDSDHVQTNYYSRGNSTTPGRGATFAIPAVSSQFHTYGLEWTAKAITWSVDGVVIRTLAYDDAQAGAAYPQTPMQVKLGTWVAGKPGAPEGTIHWAGGLADFSEAPFVAYYKSVTVTDYSNGVKDAKQYVYGDRSGTFESIKVETDGAGHNGSHKHDDHKTPTPKPKSKAESTSAKVPASTKVSAGAAASTSASTSGPAGKDSSLAAAGTLTAQSSAGGDHHAGAAAPQSASVALATLAMAGAGLLLAQVLM